MTKDNFIFNNLAVERKGKKLIIRGTAAVANKVHAHGFNADLSKSFRSFFTDNAIKKMEREMKFKRVFVDALHETASEINNEHIVETLKGKYPELENELNAIQSNNEVRKIPMFKVSNFLENNGQLEVTIESNPLFPEVDVAHEKYYNAITGSIEGGYINGISANFVGTDVSSEEGVDKINDLDFYGLSLVQGPALGSSTSIAEVATRSIKRIIETRSGELKMTENEQTKEPQKAEVKETVVPTPATSEPKVSNLVAPTPEAIQKMVQDQLDTELKRRESMAQEQQQKQEIEAMKSQLEELKKQKEQLQNQVSDGSNSGSRGTVKIEDKDVRNPDWWKERLQGMSISDAIRLQAEFQGKLPVMIPSAEHRGKHNDPRVTWTFSRPSSSMAEMHRQLSGKSADMVFN